MCVLEKATFEQGTTNSAFHGFKKHCVSGLKENDKGFPASSLRGVLSDIPKLSI